MTDTKTVCQKFDGINIEHKQFSVAHSERPDHLAEECYVVVDSPEEARVIHDRVMTQEAKRLHATRMNHVLANGVVNEHDMPDSREVIEAREKRQKQAAFIAQYLKKKEQR